MPELPPELAPIWASFSFLAKDGQGGVDLFGSGRGLLEKARVPESQWPLILNGWSAIDHERRHAAAVRWERLREKKDE